MHAPLPKAIVLSDNPKLDAATNVWTLTITVSRKLKDEKTREEFLSVIAHEIGHLLNRKTMLVQMLGAIGITALYLIFALGTIAAISPIMAELSALGLFFLLLIIINHAGEFAADSAAARIGLGDALISALQGFGDDYGYNRVSETHPSIRARIARLISRPGTGGVSPQNLSGRIGGYLNSNWTINYTTPGRYFGNGVAYHVLDYTRNVGMGSLIIIDVGCSYGVAPRRMKEYLGESGISSYVIGLDLARG